MRWILILMMLLPACATAQNRNPLLVELMRMMHESQMQCMKHGVSRDVCAEKTRTELESVTNLQALFGDEHPEILRETMVLCAYASPTLIQYRSCFVSRAASGRRQQEWDPRE